MIIVRKSATGRRALLLGALFSLGGMASRAMAQAPVDPHFVGTHVHDIGADAPLPPPVVTAIRLWDSRVTWKDLEPQRGQWKFDVLDRAVGRLVDTQREILLPLALSPPWASSRPSEPSGYDLGNAAPPARLADWEDYVRTVGTRYKGRVTHWEIWNEPNRKKFFSGDVGQMVDLVCSAQKILKSIDPANIVVSPAATDQHAGVKWVGDFLAAGGGKCVDAIGFHFYVLAHEPPEAIVPLLADIRTTMAQNNAGQLPLWDTEFGWYVKNGRVLNTIKYHQLDSQDAGNYLLRSWIIQASMGVARAYQYAWNDTQMGVLEPDTKQPKAFANDFNAAVDLLAGARISPCVNRGSQWRCPTVTKSGAHGVLWWAIGSSPRPRLAPNDAAIPSP